MARDQKQQKRLLAYLQNNRAITPMQAWTELGIYRLSAVVYKLRKNHNIVTDYVSVMNRFGEKMSVAEYKLIKE